MKTVVRSLPAFEVDMGGIPVYQPFPTNNVEQIDPFLLLHHSKFSLEGGVNPLHTGIGPHPHRGFMPVTYVISGELHHRDSLGNSSIIGAGGAQWLNAGSGVTHSERPSAKFAKEGGSTELIQLWVNLPKANKMSAPNYKGVSKEKIPSIEIADGLTFDLISGLYDSQWGAIRSPIPLLIGAVEALKDATGELILPTGMQGGLYMINGEGSIFGYGIVEEKTFYQVSSGEDNLKISLDQGAKALLILGRPIHEPLATYGPFVMNTQTEIMKSLRDYNHGKMGVLIEE